MAFSSKLSSSTTSCYQYLLILLVFLSVPLFVSSHRVFSTKGSGGSKSLKFNLKPIHRHQPVRYSVDDVRATAMSDEHSIVLLVNIWIGEPPRLQLLLMDTGSELLWVQCAPFKHVFNQIRPIFNPDDSSTFLNIPCNTNLCHEECARMTDFCPYSVAYGDGTNSTGTLGTDQLTFKDNYGKITSVEHDVVMGCGRNNFNPIASGESGILGLNAGSNSLASQRGRKFSYCIGNLTDLTYAYSNLIIGESAVMQGDTTPLDVNYYYYVTVTGIAIGGQALDIDSNVFKRQSNGRGGMIIDSGATYSYLPRTAFQTLVNRVEELAKGYWNRVQLREGDERICYSGNIWPDTIGFPTLIFLLAGGAELESGPYSMFDQASPSEFCLAFLPVNDNERGTVGLKAQQGYNIGYDPDGKKLYIYHVLCEIDDDDDS